MSDLKAPDRTSPGWGLVADALSKIAGMAEHGDIASTLSDFFDVPGAARAADRASYGGPLLNTGQANVPLVPAEGMIRDPKGGD